MAAEEVEKKTVCTLPESQISADCRNIENNFKKPRL